MPALSKHRLHRLLCLTLAGGNIAYGVAAMAKPKAVARLSQQSEDEVRAIGRRDLGQGLALLAARKPLAPLLLNLGSDAVECVTLARRKPRLAVIPGLWVVLALAAILTRD